MVTYIALIMEIDIHFPEFPCIFGQDCPFNWSEWSICLRTLNNAAASLMWLNSIQKAWTSINKS